MGEKPTRYIESISVDPAFNLALEQYVFDHLPREYGYFMLWRNDRAVIVGKHQDTLAEINEDYVKEKDIRVVRRLSGGGAVYHDLGNLNFTFIVDDVDGEEESPFERFCEPVIAMLKGMGIEAERTGRNDMAVNGRKFSGNAQYRKDGRIMHHGTILFDTDLYVMEKALRVSEEKLKSKGVKSVRGRVTNLRPLLPEGVTMERFMGMFRAFMFKAYGLERYELTGEDISQVREIQAERYHRWKWNFGAIENSNNIRTLQIIDHGF